MSPKTSERPDELMSGLPGLVIPLLEEPDSNELRRRQALVKRARQLRQAIKAESGPLPVSTSDLKHEAREAEHT